VISVYVASRFDDQLAARRLRDALAERGIGCTSRWLEEEPALGSILTDEKRRHVAEMDVHDVRRAQALVLWNPEQADPTPRARTTGGLYVEMGVAVGEGKPIFVVGKRTNVFCWLPRVFHHVEPSGTEVNRRALLDNLAYAIKAACPDFGPTFDSPEEQAERRESEKFARNDGERCRNDDGFGGRCGLRVDHNGACK
jgi:hypothetical protein